MNSESPEVVSNQFYYKSIDQYAPRYKYVKIQMSNILGSDVPVSVANATQVHFKLPYNTCYNLAKSKLSCLVPIPVQAGGKISNIVADAFPFANETITFETGNGLQLLNLQEPSRYTKIVSKIQTKYKDYITRDTTDNPHPAFEATAANNATAIGTAQSCPIVEPEYFIQSAAATLKNVPINYELSNFQNTIIGLNKTVYFGQNDMFLKISIGPVNKWVFQSDSVNPADGTLTLGTALTTIKNMYLWVAVEQNPTIIDLLTKQYHSTGLKLQIDYPFVTRVTTAASTSQNLVIPFVPSQGKYLKRVYHSVFASGDTLNLTLDCENRAGAAKISSYNTYIDSTKLQDDTVVCATAPSDSASNNDDWRINQQFCRDSAISNYATYQKSWFHCDDFTNPDMEKDNPNNAQNVRSGLPMERGIQYQFLGTNAGTALIHTNFAIFTRDILINRDGCQFI